MKPLSSPIDRNASLEEQIHGTQATRILGVFFSVSALYPILDAIRGITAEGWIAYLSDLPHYLLFIAAFIQAWFLGSSKRDDWKILFAGNLLGFALYAPLDIALEGVYFFREPYHWVFGGFSLVMAITSALQSVTRHRLIWQTLTTLVLNLSKVLLLPVLYLIIELHLEMPGQLSWQSWQTYMEQSGHQFIFYGMVLFGILLGLSDAQRLHYARFLRQIAQQLKQYSEWSLSSDLITDSLLDPDVLKLQRVERTMLFMDIRNFTAWTEKIDPQQAVDMLNQYYKAAETIISHHQGHKPSFTADEVMSRFQSAQAALETALALQAELSDMLAPYNLSVGIGLHTGEVIEGLMGSDTTRKYDIIGDAVNTTKRLESAAGAGEIVISAETYDQVSHADLAVESRTIQVKGKVEPLSVLAIQA